MMKISSVGILGCPLVSPGALKGILDVVRKEQALQVSRSNKRASSPHFKSSLCHCHHDLAFQKRQLDVSLIIGKHSFMQIFFFFTTNGPRLHSENNKTLWCFCKDAQTHPVLWAGKSIWPQWNYSRLPKPAHSQAIECFPKGLEGASGFPCEKVPRISCILGTFLVTSPDTRF